jgi:hypothetical protein
VDPREPPQPTHCIYTPYVQLSFQRLLVQLSPGSQWLTAHAVSTLPTLPRSRLHHYCT